MTAPINSPDDFLAGQIACQNGDKVPEDASIDFQRGYACEYEKEQVLTDISLQQERLRGRQWN